VVFASVAAIAHPLGNFINHFARIQLERDRVGIHYVVDMAEISTFQELTDTDKDGAASSAELNAYAVLHSIRRWHRAYRDGIRVPQTVAKKVTTLPGAGGLPTLRVDCDFAGAMSMNNSSTPHRLGLRTQIIATESGVNSSSLRCRLLFSTALRLMP